MHTNNKLKQTAVSFQQPRVNEEDDLSSSTSSSSTFSSSSQQHSSVDYEAEDENEDKQRQRRHKDENDSLIHVQNFLKCFGANALVGSTLRAVPAATSTATSTLTSATAPAAKITISSSTELRNWRHNYRTVAATPITTACGIASTAAASIVTTPVATSTTQTTHFNNSKPQKFQINTKFLRKPRNKLMKMLPTTNTTQQQQQQQQRQEQQQLTQLYIDDSNAKFKDFSIDSLLNN
ncbi:hypothetical protein ACLKA7_010917 [Drosophila subpalustris]